MQRLRTTTWKYRNSSMIIEAEKEAYKIGLTSPVIIDFGPGGVAEIFAKCLPIGEKENWDYCTRIKRSCIQPLESIARKTGLLDLRTFEPLEIYERTRNLNPKIIYILDKEKRIVQLVDKLVSEGVLPQNVSTGIIDLATCEMPFKGDLIFAYNVVQRTDNPEKAIANISISVNPGGILSMMPEFDLKGFQKIGLGLYIKNN